MIEHDNNDISRIMDRALSSYVVEDELAGLPQRVLGRIQEDVRSRKQRRWLLFAFAFAGICFAVIALVVIPPSRSSLRGRSATQALLPPASTSAERQSRRELLLPSDGYKRANTSARVAVRRPRRSLPKLDQFPAPTPLTNEERALLRVPAQAAAHLFAKGERSGIDPIQIKPLRIEPL
ncbi:MAG: hypothetical protein JOZ45_11480 [Acidobacteriaceae bacterium]|nr:hypothetical protein [Acidobacteriaceae bacterium]MBV9306756.1 hypothetical protein [Acidobacteriaceae bacterium]